MFTFKISRRPAIIFPHRYMSYIFYGDRSANDFHLPVYETVYRRSIEEREEFWADLAKDVHWHKPCERVMDTSDKHFTKWFTGGQINMAYNCLDRHILEGRGSMTCFFEESAYTGHRRSWTYQEVYERSGRLASVF